MPARFAALEARVDRAVFAHISNQVGILDGEPVQGILDEAYVDAQGIASTSPVVLLPRSVAAHAEPDLSQFVKGDLVDGTVYIVAAIEPAGGDMMLLRLRQGR